MNSEICNGGRTGHPRVCLGLILAAALAGTSCTDAPGSKTPTTFMPTSANVTISTASATVSARPVNGSFCPAVPPFSVPVVLVVRPNGAVGLVVTRIQMQFTDSSRVPMAQVTLPAPVPTTQFGDALEASRDGLTFPLSLGVGCGTGTSGTVVVIVDTRDGDGRTGTGRVTLNVR
jgi:hypothetical protein